MMNTEMTHSRSDDAAILIVEDDFIVAENMRERLQALGYRIAGIAATGEEALKLAAEATPDVVLMDVRLDGEMDGVDTVAALKDYVRTPVLYVTAYTDRRTVMRARDTMPYGYIVKPFTTEELWSNIEIALYKGEVDRSIREKEWQSRELLDQTLDGIMVVDVDRGRIIRANVRAAELLPRIRDGVDELSLTQVFPQEIARRLSEETPEEQREIVYLGSELPGDEDTEVRYVDIARRLLLWNGERMMQIVIREVTEHVRSRRKLAGLLAEHERLLLEVHHRVKNNLQIISSLLDFQERENISPQAAESLRQAQSRIQALARVHEELQREGVSAGVAVEHYLRSLTSELANVYSRLDVTLDVRAAGIHMAPSRLIPIGLAVTELVSNSLKHGLPQDGVDDPTICISLVRTGEEFALTVEDNGVGIVEGLDSIRQQENGSLGLRIVEMVSRQLRGRVEIATDGPVRVEIRFPADPADAP
jgi:two-component sensor histidine kinase/DNA-binding response OmpR family regulator